jgi:hypothetical protein
MPARNPEAVRQRVIDAARQRSGQPAATPSLDPVFVALNHGELPVRARSGGELAARSAALRTTRSWARGWWWSCTPKATRLSPARGPGRSPAAPIVPTGWLASVPAAASAARPTVATGPADHAGRRRQGSWLPIPADPTRPEHLSGEQRFRGRPRRLPGQSARRGVGRAAVRAAGMTRTAHVRAVGPRPSGQAAGHLAQAPRRPPDVAAVAAGGAGRPARRPQRPPHRPTVGRRHQRPVGGRIACPPPAG